ncbi:choice-of-anchor M domain-containing protein [Propionicicella superfundia]|uniref:choice-of-anchor M domain-containing protein n=1 Tax=Propionicicella superfundia TaxID=348582 RepID=UPI0004235FAE|nr:choice-of-anchor M domain-containing protein [Propionicicella superfundia]
MSAHKSIPRLGVTLALAVGLALLVLGSGITQARADPLREYVLPKGHIDLFEVTYDAESAGLKLSVKDDTRIYSSGVEFRAPEETSLLVDSGLAVLDLSGMPSAYDFLKVDGTTVYYLPQTQNPDLPWPGWSTERLPSTLPDGVSLSATGSPVELDLQIEGPGEVFTWQTGTFGGVQNTYVNTADPAPDVIPIARNAHVHTNWVFTQPGDYYLTVTPSATTTTGETLTGPSASYHIRVGAATDLALVSTAKPVVSGTPAPGETLTATGGTWERTPDSVTYQWLADGQPITGATGSTLDVTDALLGSQISVEVTATKLGRTNGVAVSDPVGPVATPAPSETPSPSGSPSPTGSPSPSESPSGSALPSESPSGTGSQTPNSSESASDPVPSGSSSESAPPTDQDDEDGAADPQLADTGTGAGIAAVAGLVAVGGAAGSLLLRRRMLRRP